MNIASAPLPHAPLEGAVLQHPIRAVLVVGMHRSGTSALARTLNLLGAQIPGPVVGSFHGNETGHWEPAEIVDVHDAMLRSAGSNVNSVFGVDPAWFESEAARGFAETLAEVLERARQERPQTRLWVVKDPRMALFIPVWRDALARLGVEPVFVIPFRDPAEVAASLRRRQLHVFPDTVWPDARGLLLWLAYVLASERATRGSARAFVRFDALLEDWRRETTRIAEQLDLSWPNPEPVGDVEAFLRRELKHERAAAAGADLPDVVADVLDALEACVADPQAGAEAFDRAGNAYLQAGDLFRDYVEALEIRLGATPGLKTEYADFLQGAALRAERAAVEAARRSAEQSDPLEAAWNAADEDGRRALMLQAIAERRSQAARLTELQQLNEALLEVQRRATTAAAQAQAAATAQMEAARSAAQAEIDDARAQRLEFESALRSTQAAVTAADAQVEAIDAARRRLQAERDELRQELERAAVQAAGLTGDRDAAREQQESLARERDDLASQRDAMADANARLNTEHAALAEELERSLAANRGLEAALAEITRSTSWRLTQPIRTIGSIGRGGGRG